MSSKKIAKTNAARLLERLEIPFTLHQADVDESDLSAVTMAHKLGVDPGCVFKHGSPPVRYGSEEYLKCHWRFRSEMMRSG